MIIVLTSVGFSFISAPLVPWLSIICAWALAALPLPTKEWFNATHCQNRQLNAIHIQMQPWYNTVRCRQVLPENIYCSPNSPCWKLYNVSTGVKSTKRCEEYMHSTQLRCNFHTTAVQKSSMHAFVHPIFASLIFLKATSAVGRFLFGESIKTEQWKSFLCNSCTR